MLSTSPTSAPVARVILKPRRARPFFARHPWVLDAAIERVEALGEQPLVDGDVVDLMSDRGQFIARGLFNSQSRLRVRLYSWTVDELLDREFWRRQLTAAAALRHQLGLDHPAQATRLVSSEADGVSGLTVERFGAHLVLQITSLGIARRVDDFVALAVEIWQPTSIAVRTERELNKLEGLALEDGVRFGTRPDEPVFIEEHGLRYGVDLAAGQKTGFYLDQRENRRAAASYLRSRRVLDVCCYTGGFSLAAVALGGAREVLGIDSSARAIALAQANAALNEIPNARFETGDCFTRLEALAASEQRFEAVILDPPKFARNRAGVEQALRAYHQLNLQALKVLQPTGILVTCSCSGHVSREDFMLMLAEVSQRSGRNIQVLETRGAAADHPVSAACLESEYLKCFICRVL